MIIAVLNVEHGKVGDAIKNLNGTYDLGPMQINSRWLPELKKYSITEKSIQFDPCTNVRVGAWILSKAIANDHDLIKGIGNYHSHTPRLNESYSQKIKVNFTKINLLLSHT